MWGLVWGCGLVWVRVLDERGGRRRQRGRRPVAAAAGRVAAPVPGVRGHRPGARRRVEGVARAGGRAGQGGAGGAAGHGPASSRRRAGRRARPGRCRSRRRSGPRRRIRWAGPRGGCRRRYGRGLHRRSRALRMACHPLVAPVVFAAALEGFYLSPVFEASLRDHAVHSLATVVWVVSAPALLWPLVGVDQLPWRPSRPARVPTAAVLVPVPAVCGAEVGGRGGGGVPAADWFGGLGRTWGMSLSADQRGRRHGAGGGRGGRTGAAGGREHPPRPPVGRGDGRPGRPLPGQTAQAMRC